VARAVDYAHQHGILHRDLQPGNILLDARSEPMVSDFGLAKWLDQESNLTRTLTSLGTPGFIAPEQAEGTTFSPAADIYSLGAILFNLLVGRPPFVGNNALSVIRQAAAQPAPKLRFVARSFDRDLETIVARCLEREPRARYQTAGVLAEDLERWLDDRPIVARPIRAPARVWRWSRRNPTLAGAAIACLFLTLVVGWLLRERLKISPISPPPEKSVAVLPFQNLSNDKDNATFTNGVQDEILTDLSHVADLKVISRTSAMQYKDAAKRNLPEIAQQLGVANVVEGSVQRVANRVRVNAQLIDARSDKHLWAQTYDGDLTDVFGIQTQIARAIAEQLHAKISAGEKAVIAQPSTTDLKANTLYQEALNLESKQPEHENLRQAIRLLDQAVARDPKFLLAYCAMSRMHLNLYFDGYDHTPARRELANVAIQNAARIQPEAGEVHLAAAGYWHRGFLDYDRARAELDLARRTLPNDPKVYLLAASLDRRQGRWSEAVRNVERAVELDPRDMDCIMMAGLTYEGLNRYSDATRMFERALSVSPRDYTARIGRAFQSTHEYAEIQTLRAELDSILADEPDAAPKIADTLFLCSIDQRDRAATERALAAIPPEGIPLIYNFLRPREWYVGYAARTFGDLEAARTAFTTARAIVEKTVREQPDYAEALSLLARIDARLGRKEEAISEGRRACELVPISKDAWSGPWHIRTLAEIYALLGEKDLALEQLSKLQPPQGVCVELNYGELKLDPDWDPLRDDPRFEKIVASFAPKAESNDVAARQSVPEKSIAVLPFENLSEEKQNAYFAEGMQDEVLTNLARVADLKVISRTSTQAYQSNPGNLAEIARQLGVANILEGSVQKAGDQVRVNVQLINAQTDSHLWAETYDRKLTDIFGVESEIAKRIAAALQAKLTGREEQALAVKPTDNPEAYDAYLRGLAFEAHGFAAAPASINLVSKAADFYELAVQLDPKFAIAWARLSRADADLYFNRAITNSPARGEAAKRALENAQKLEPESPETLLALGYYQYWVLGDYAQAKTTFDRVSKMLPGSSEIPTALGRVTRREGQWDQSIAYYGDALALDPRNSVLLFDAASTYAMVRKFPAALKLYDRALDITPNDPEMMAAKAEIYQAQGNLEEAARFLSEVNERTPSEDIFSIKINQLRLERNYGEGVRLLQARLSQFHFASQFDRAREQVDLAWMQRFAGDMAGARVTAEQARNTLGQLHRDQPDNYYFPLWLALAYAAVGDKDSAIKAAENAITLLPRAKDAVEGPDLEENLALIQTIVGENSRAIATLTQLLQTPYARWVTARPPITPALLRLDPIWDSLHGDPRFEKLVASLAPKKR
jgi:TolB-like protein/Tfp pilus assembly protein PilF